MHRPILVYFTPVFTTLPTFHYFFLLLFMFFQRLCGACSTVIVCCLLLHRTNVINDKSIRYYVKSDALYEICTD